jgi:riboflavin-specific deaminase-like protein
VKRSVSHTKDPRLPYVFLNVATSADGKLAPASRNFVPFSSKRDQDLLMTLRTEADAVMSGALTVRGKVDLGPGGEKYQKLRLKRGFAEYNLRVVATGTGSLRPDAYIFQQKFSPVLVLTTSAVSKRYLQSIQKVAGGIHISKGSRINFTEGLQWLRGDWNVRRLLCEGGGEINGALFEENLVDDIYLTISPLIFGGRNAPTLADGEGVARVADSINLKLRGLRRVADELFLKYSVIRK